jgi:hypothetical protein
VTGVVILSPVGDHITQSLALLREPAVVDVMESEQYPSYVGTGWHRSAVAYFRRHRAVQTQSAARESGSYESLGRETRSPRLEHTATSYSRMFDILHGSSPS